MEPTKFTARLVTMTFARPEDLRHGWVEAERQPAISSLLRKVDMCHITVVEVFYGPMLLLVVQ